MLKRSGLLLACATLLLQFAVYLQPLLPEQYHIAPVCLSITHNLLSPKQHQHVHASYHALIDHLGAESGHHHDHNEHNHQCQYCTVYGNLVLPPELSVKEVLDRIQVRFIAFEKAFQHVWFALQRLFLIPQGRAPPLFA